MICDGADVYGWECGKPVIKGGPAGTFTFNPDGTDHTCDAPPVPRPHVFSLVRGDLFSGGNCSLCGHPRFDPLHHVTQLRRVPRPDSIPGRGVLADDFPMPGEWRLTRSFNISAGEVQWTADFRCGEGEEERQQVITFLESAENVEKLDEPFKCGHCWKLYRLVELRDSTVGR